MKTPYFVRPVGESIKARASKKGDNAELPAYERYQREFYASGTMALQAALTAMKQHMKIQGAPKCMLAGYACPDLISACVGAQVEPVLLDTEFNSPFPSEQSIETAAKQGCNAIILVNFLGISPPKTLVDKCKQLGLFIIEDRAQSFVSPLNNKETLFGDAVIFSFGKGKPLSLLGGGMLLIKNKIQFQAVSDNAENSILSMIKTRLSIIFYNLIIRPILYPALLKIPILSVGATYYHPPQSIKAIDEARFSLLPSAIRNFDLLPFNKAQNIVLRLNTTLKLLDICPLVGENDPHRMLRLPLLAHNKEMRDDLVSQLVEHGIGATKLYQKSLPEVQGIPAQLKAQLSSSSQLINACNFADRLFTIPCHSGVTAKDIETIKGTMETYIIPKEIA